jgi:hypothetical protein
LARAALGLEDVLLHGPAREPISESED